MRFIALAVIIILLPVFVSWLRQSVTARPLAITFVALSAFLSGVVKLDASIITWPMWTGTVRGITISVVDMLALALIITRARRPVYRPFTWIIVAYLVVVSISTIGASVPMASSFYVFQILRVLIIVWAIVPELFFPKALAAVLNGFGLGLIIQASYVIFQKATGVVQAHGTMIHQNTLGFMTELALFPLMASLVAGDSSKSIKLGVVSGLIIIAGGGSRATLLISSVGVLVFILLSLAQRSTPTKTRIAGAMLFAGVIVTPLAMTTMSSRFAGSSVFTEEAQRTAMARAARDMASDHYLGAGANLYVTEANLQGYSQRAGVTWGGATRAAPVHNAYLLARAETGWLGQVLFLGLFIIPMLAGLRHAFKYRTSLDGSIALGSAVALGATAIHSNYEFVAQTYNPQLLIFLNIALCGGMVSFRHPLSKARNSSLFGVGNRVVAGRNLPSRPKF